MNSVTKMAARKSRTLLQLSLQRGVTRPNDQLFPRFRTTGATVISRFSNTTFSRTKFTQSASSPQLHNRGNEMFGPKKNGKIGPGQRDGKEAKETELSIQDNDFVQFVDIGVGAFVKVIMMLMRLFVSSIPKEMRFVEECKKMSCHLWLDVSGCRPDDVKVFSKGRKFKVEATSIAHTFDTRLPRVRKHKLLGSFKYDPREASASVKNGMLLILLPYSESDVDLDEIGEVQILVVKA